MALWKREAPLCVLMVFIDGSHVSSAIGLSVTGKPIKILEYESGSIQPSERTPEHIKGILPTLLSESVQRVTASFAKRPDAKTLGPVQKVVISVGSPYVKARTVHASKTFTDPHSVTNSDIQELARSAMDLTFVAAGATQLETQVTTTLLNGYPTSEPVGKRASHMSIIGYQSSIDTTVQSAISQHVGAAMPGITIEIRSHVRVLSLVAHQLIPNERECTIIHFGDDASECIVVRKEELGAHESLSLGTMSIVQAIAGPTGSGETILSSIRLVASDSCNDTACIAIKEQLAKQEPELVKKFGDLFANLSSSRRMPNMCILSVSESFAPWAQFFFSRIDFSPFTVSGNALSVVLLTPMKVAPYALMTPASANDPDMATLAAFVNITRSYTSA